MEGLEVIKLSDYYKNRKVLVTGHTGFKGSWLTLWLKKMGADIAGISLNPDTNPSHWDLLNLQIKDHRIDIQNTDALKKIIREFLPEVVFHCAAQSLVRKSYTEPINTWNVNVMGTLNLLESCRDLDSIHAIVVVTSDKCYQNNEWVWGYRENDPLGGSDPYSASKAAVELAVNSYRNSFFQSGYPYIATVRAGNVIGGGDWAEDRLIPDCMRAIADGKPLEMRNPGAVRPWQHVLEPLAGYLKLGAYLLEGKHEYASEWNFGPRESSCHPVEAILEELKINLPALSWLRDNEAGPYEANILKLDSSKAMKYLKWESVWSFEKTIEKTAKWYKAFIQDGKVISNTQLEEYQEAAHG